MSRTKPVVGINCDVDVHGGGRLYKRPYVYLYLSYFEAVLRAGGIPFLLPLLQSESDAEELIAQLDALLLTGCGGDVDPASYGTAVQSATKIMPELRQRFDMILIRTALAKSQIPILAICAGMQLVNVAAGGTLIQDLQAINPDATDHHQLQNAERMIHKVRIEGLSRLAKIIGGSELEVNSTHHQAIDEVANGFVVSARASEGVIEAIEATDERFILCVQWHPERLSTEHRHQRLFEALIEQAKSQT